LPERGYLSRILGRLPPFRRSPINMSASAAQFASSADLVYYVGKLISNRQSLRDCCLVSKNFNASFTPLLYSEVWFRQNNISFLLEDLPLLLNNRALKYTRTFDVAIDMIRDGGNWTADEMAVYRSYNEAVQSLLVKMPMLQTFRYACSYTAETIQ
jgi:hypothetical protein